MRRIRLLVATTAALCALAIVPVASAGWEGQIDFVGEDDGVNQTIDVGPKGPSPGDVMRFNQIIKVVGLTYNQASLQLGALGTLTGTFTYLTPNLLSANIVLRLKAGLIRVTGWLGALDGPPTDATFLAKGNGGLFTGSRGTVVVYDNGDDNTRQQNGFKEQPDFSVILH